MQSSSKPCQHIPDMPPQQEPQSPMPPLGSISSDGQSTMPASPPQKSLGDVLGRMAEMVKQRQAVMAVTTPPAPATKVSASKPSVVQPAKPLALKDDPEGQDQLTDLLSQTYASQQTYGDKAQMMDYREKMFQLVLGEYSIASIQSAFVEHIKRSSALPTPHDIASLIDPSLEPLSPAMYVRISEKIKNGYTWVSNEEREYARQFEERELRKIKQTA
jgi:hypothetical protein